MKTSLQLVTPELAQKYLQKNSINRPIRESRVGVLCNEILMGNWKTTHQGIAISKSGILLDGQHRLSAIVKAGIPVEILVFSELDEKTFSVIDKGIARTHADTIGINNNITAILNFIAINVHGSRYASTDTIIYLNNLLSDDIASLLENCHGNKPIVSQAPLRVAALICAHRFGADYVHTLYRNIVASNFDVLPPIGQAFFKQVVSNSLAKDKAGGQRQLIVFTKTMDLFDKSKRNQTRIIYTEEKKQAALDALSIFYKNKVKEKEKSDWASF